MRYADLDLPNNKSIQSDPHQGNPLVRDYQPAAHEHCAVDAMMHTESKTSLANHSYDLRGLVIHYGTGMTFGHYWALAKTQGKHNPKWVEYDDTKIRVVDDHEVHLYYGQPHGVINNDNWHCAYMLLYQS